MTVLLHTCCAGCLLGAFSGLRREEWELRPFFFNPNIHPLLEFRKRVKALKVLRDQLKGRPEMVIREEYGLGRFLREVAPGGEKSCERCYELRLGETARVAAKEGFEGFSTTLLVSRHQKHELVKRVGEKVGAEAGVKFLYVDLRDEIEGAAVEAKRRRLYRQQYCGCIFSEEERYRNSRTELYSGKGDA